MKKYNIELTEEEVRLIRVSLETHQFYLEGKGIKPETVEQCDEMIERLFALVKGAK